MADMGSVHGCTRPLRALGLSSFALALNFAQRAQVFRRMRGVSAGMCAGVCAGVCRHACECGRAQAAAPGGVHEEGSNIVMALYSYGPI